MTKVVYYYSECTGEMVYAIEYYQSGVAILVYLYELRLDSKERRGYGKAQRVNNVPGRRV